MAPLLKDCGLEGCSGSVQHCPDCQRATVHFRWPGGSPVCGWCGFLAALFPTATAVVAYARSHIVRQPSL
jgi:hypothetical protein